MGVKKFEVRVGKYESGVGKFEIRVGKFESGGGNAVKASGEVEAAAESRAEQDTLSDVIQRSRGYPVTPVRSPCRNPAETAING